VISNKNYHLSLGRKSSHHFVFAPAPERCLSDIYFPFILSMQSLLLPSLESILSNSFVFILLMRVTVERGLWTLDSFQATRAVCVNESENIF
jgi:hypothetical protein